ncbi:MAG: DUF4440 domain-containing protein [Ignavibacteria bacterium]|nr:MAG: DUF4440 domain-containing protein [Ignavibacteria bacterium]
MVRGVAIPSLTLIILSAGGPGSGQSADSSGIAEIRSVIEIQAKAWNRGDIDGYMEYYWHSDSMLFTSGGQIRRGWQATLDKYKKSYNSREKMGTLRFSEVEVHLLSPESAWAFGHWELKRKNDHPGGVFTVIFRKFADGWKIIHDHTSAEARK